MDGFQQNKNVKMKMSAKIKAFNQLYCKNPLFQGNSGNYSAGRNYR